VLAATGALGALGQSAWRRRRLLIICYHSIALRDEHLWNPDIYLSLDQFRHRLDLLRRWRAAVLPLGEAVQRLYDGSLPPRAVVLTFDDGTADFAERAWPALKEFGYPVTVYVTTHYAEYPGTPVFPIIVSYLAWRAGRRQVDVADVMGGPSLVCDLRRGDGDVRMLVELRERAGRAGLTTAEKHDLVARFAEHLGVDFDAVVASRVLQIMRPDEVARVGQEGADVQLHTHRHRVPEDRALFVRELDDNRARLAAWTSTRGAHFCYPSGVHKPMFLPWLAEAGVETATTCEPGLASPSSNPLLLPRYIDTGGSPDHEYLSWVSGFGAAFAGVRRMAGGARVHR
jgi:peptidoglycan/xylan/chitin deacetylase (PgdA/CDA1 family)